MQANNQWIFILVTTKKIIMILKNLLYILIVLLFSFCGKFSFDDKFKLKRENYYGNQLKLSGYYYNGDSLRIHESYFLFQNGIVLVGNGSDQNVNSSFAFLESQFTSQQWKEEIKSKKKYWGTFQLVGNLIKLERYYSSDGQNKSYIFEGEITNDTTFIFNKSSRSNGKEKSNENKVFHFKIFKTKPDSTNKFIK
jgi:hypothetical protein